MSGLPELSVGFDHPQRAQRPFRQTRWTEARFKSALEDFSDRVCGVRRRHEERLVQRPAPSEEASWANASVELADVTMGLRSLPFEPMMMLFMGLALRDRNLSYQHHWEKVADFWGITPGEARATVGRAISAAVARLNAPNDNAPY